MDLISLNKIGIILNFIAGIIITPDIIGKRRLAKWEKYIERRFANAKMEIEMRVGQKMTNGFMIFYFLFFPLLSSIQLQMWLAFISTIGIVLGILSMTFISQNGNLTATAIILIGLCYILMVVVSLADSDRSYKRRHVPKGAIDHLIKQPFNFHLDFWVSILNLLYVFVLTILNMPVRFMLYILSGKGKLSKQLSLIGLILYIVGNLLQLLVAE